MPQSGEGAGVYELREKDFWTCGFFPGSLYAILERAMKFPQFLPIPADCKPMFQKDLLDLGRTWSEEIHNMAGRTDTHDMGFIVQPSLQMDWGLTGNERSLKSVILAAEALASRYDDRVGAIRSWDGTINKRYCYTDKEVDFLVIIDSMCSKSPIQRDTAREILTFWRPRSSVLRWPPHFKSKAHRHRYETCSQSIGNYCER